MKETIIKFEKGKQKKKYKAYLKNKQTKIINNIKIEPPLNYMNT